MDEVFPKLKQYVSPEQAAAKRKSYVVYIRADWGKSLNFDGFTAAKYIKELILIETDYFSSRPLFSWDDVYALVTGENIEAIGSKAKPRSIFNNNMVRPPTKSPSAAYPFTVGKPRFSFLSR
jgi:hypothetical protein